MLSCSACANSAGGHFPPSHPAHIRTPLIFCKTSGHRALINRDACRAKAGAGPPRIPAFPMLHAHHSVITRREQRIENGHEGRAVASLSQEEQAVEKNQSFPQRRKQQPQDLWVKGCSRGVDRSDCWDRLPDLTAGTFVLTFRSGSTAKYNFTTPPPTLCCTPNFYTAPHTIQTNRSTTHTALPPSHTPHAAPPPPPKKRIRCNLT